MAGTDLIASLKEYLIDVSPMFEQNGLRDDNNI